MKLSVQEVGCLLSVSRCIRHVRQSVARYTKRFAVCLWKQSHVDLVIVKVCADGQERRISPQLMWSQVLRIEALLTARIMLLNPVAVRVVIQEEREV